MQGSVTLQTVWWKWNYPRSYEYRWADGAKIKRPIEVSAPKYVEYLMDWIETQLDEETIFPQKLGNWFVWSQRIRALKNCILIILGLCGLTIMWCLVRHCDANRGSFPSQLPWRCQDDLQAPLQGVRAHIPLAFSDDYQAQGRGTSQHLLQALHALHIGNSRSNCLLHFHHPFVTFPPW